MAITILRFVLAGVVGYLLGSFPSGVIVGKLWRVNVLAAGSGHSGATNVLRTAGKKAAAMVAISDVAKGAFAVLLAHFLLFAGDAPLAPWGELVAGLAAILGHNYSLFLRFRGGRGVATGGGAILGIQPLVLAIAVLVGLVPAALTRYVSLGSITAAFTAPLAELALLLTGFDHAWPHFYFILIGSAVVIASHHDNIQRLLNGTERKLGQRTANQGAVLASPAQDSSTEQSTAQDASVQGAMPQDSYEPDSSALAGAPE
jgi:glycerol-3-phosphate acyltransferase PlsY